MHATHLTIYSRDRLLRVRHRHWRASWNLYPDLNNEYSRLLLVAKQKEHNGLWSLVGSYDIFNMAEFNDLMI